MFFNDDEAVRFSCPPVFEFTQGEIEELFSLINQPLEPASPVSGSQGSNSNRPVYSTRERKLRRMESNRESAKRSRWRKKRHLENVTHELNRLRIENRELKNRLGLTVHHHLLLSAENECLRTESMALLGRLLDLYRTLDTMLSQ